MRDPLPERLRALLAHLDADLVERDAVLRVALLGVLAGDNVLLLGPPGTAKSLVARRLTEAVAGARCFQYLLTRFTTPEELFGPVSLAALRERDAFERKVEGYLPSAEIAFIDEVFKASSAILNTLLTLLNERVFFNGAAPVPVPLVALIGASNETPADDTLAALYDRFGVRLLVAPVGSEAGFLALVEGGGDAAPVPDALALRPEELTALRARAAEVRLSPAAQRAVLKLRAGLNERAAACEDPDRFYVSDRRWRNGVRLLRIAAAVVGRGRVEPVDLTLLRHTLWNHPEDAAAVAALVDEALEDPALALGDGFGPVHARWTALLTGLRDTPDVGEALSEGWALRWGAERWTLSDAELDGCRTADPEALLRFGLIGVDGQLRRVRTTDDGRPRTRWGHSLDEALRLVRFGQGRDALELEAGEVVARRRLARGVRFGFGALPRLAREARLTEVEALRAALDTLDAARGAAAEALEAQLQVHPFITDAGPLRAGQARAALLLDEWRAQVDALAGALQAGGRWATAEIEPTAAMREALESA
ncbi:MAG: AAA family ATPase [Alphaproteobacteria bacterium]|nr:AAA family ATPase [Alphaproteobacteria bacterium]